MLNAIILNVLNLTLNGVDLVVRFTGIVDSVISLFNAVLWLGSWLLFMMFLKRLAVYLHERHLNADADDVIRLGVILFIGGIVTPFGMIVLNFLPCVGAIIGLAIAIALLIGAIIFLVKYIKLLMNYRMVLE